MFAFVILHYKTLDDTIKCVESIKKIDCYFDVKIIIVDNYSNNGSYEELCKKYNADEEIILVHNETNIGFARGNNKGYQLAKKLGADFIAISNNDIVIDSKDIIIKTKECYEKYGFSVMGPDIVSLVDNGHQNPSPAMTNDTRLVKKRINRYRALYLLNKTPFYDFLKRKSISSDVSGNPPKKINHYIKECQLHGSFIIYSKAFIDKERYAFCPNTFLYTEEPILYQYCRRKKYLTIYNPEIIVFHKEDSSTNAKFNVAKEKREFMFSNLIKSHKVYLKQLEEKTNEW